LHAAVILLHFLASDSSDAVQKTKFESFSPKTWGAGTESFESQLDHYADLDYWVVLDFSKSIEHELLSGLYDCFEGPLFKGLVFVNSLGMTRLQQEWPEVYREFFPTPNE